MRRVTRREARGGIVDLHSHVLPGVDDGARDMAESVEMARAAVADGVAVLAATPHVRSDYPTDAAHVLAGVELLQQELRAQDVPLRVVPGGEVGVHRLTELDDEELRRFGLGGNPAVILVEAPYSGLTLPRPHPLYDLMARGFTAVIAHPERSHDVRRDPERVRPLVEAGALIQVTAGSLGCGVPSDVRAAARSLIGGGLAHMIASDGHGPRVRRPSVAVALETIEDEALADWLARGVPRAIVERTAIPERPDPPAPRRSLGRPWRRRRRG
jgi:protein-tyrosine phosphatase